MPVTARVPQSRSQSGTIRGPSREAQAPAPNSLPGPRRPADPGAGGRGHSQTRRAQSPSLHCGSQGKPGRHTRARTTLTRSRPDTSPPPPGAPSPALPNTHPARTPGGCTTCSWP
nr:PREDICTED: proline-rich protein HaeIII subfamily 1-like [Struthio camelus australis]